MTSRPVAKLTLGVLSVVFLTPDVIRGPLAASAKGRVSAASYRQIASGSTFTIAPSTAPLSLSEQNLRAAIERQLTAKGLVVSSDPNQAQYEVQYDIQVGSPKIVSSPDFVVGGHSVDTIYVRTLRIAIVDINAGREAREPVIVWQCELYSEGRSADLGLLGAPFVDQGFRHWGKTVTNVKFKAKL